MNGDSLLNLPVDDEIPQTHESEIVHRLFGSINDPAMENWIKTDLKQVGIVLLLVFIVFLPVFDGLLTKFLPPFVTQSEYLLLGVKSLIVAILFWFISNFSLAKAV